MKIDKELITKEIVELHVFFEDWFAGKCENSDEIFATRFSDRMLESFVMIPPEGKAVVGPELFGFLKSVHGSNPDFGIEIRNVKQHELGEGDVVVAYYEEWQRNAINSEPSNNGRISTVIFAKDSAGPNGLKWQHVQETWLPAEQVSVASFDW